MNDHAHRTGLSSSPRCHAHVTRRAALAAFLPLMLLASLVSDARHTNDSLSAATLRQVAESSGKAIGTAAAAAYLHDPNYAGILGAEFSQLEPENEMKFALVHPRPDSDAHPFDFAAADALVSFAESHHMKVRGHTLVWHEQVAGWVANGHYTSAQLSQVLHNHIATLMKHYATRVYAWDVVNEAFNEDGSLRPTLWYDSPGIGFAGKGTGYIEQALRWAREADAHSKLFYNDYDAEVLNAKSDAIYAMARDFRRRGVPLDGIGFQMHLDLSFNDPAKLASLDRNIQRFAALGLELHITELDIRLTGSAPASLDAQAKLYGEVTRACTRQPACKLIQTWGVTDKHSWIPHIYPRMGWALLWDEHYARKPAYHAVHDALRK